MLEFKRVFPIPGNVNSLCKSTIHDSHIPTKNATKFILVSCPLKYILNVTVYRIIMTIRTKYYKQVRQE